MDALQLEGVNALDSFVVGFAGDPAEGLVRSAIGEDDVGVFTRDAGNQSDGCREIFDFGRDGESGIDHHRHREFVASPIVNHSTLGGERDGTLLLVSGLLDEFAVTEYLKIDQAAADGDAP
jgi:hypothetical protein